MEIYNKLAVILFKTFFDANTAREFLQNGSNFKDSERFNFQVRWFKAEDEYFISSSMKSKIVKYCNRFAEMNNQNMNTNFMGYNGWNNDMPQNNNMMNMNQMGMNHMMNAMNMQMQNMPMNMQYQMQMQNMQNFQANNMQMNNQAQVNPQPCFQKQNSIEDDKKSNIMQNGKYTCRFEIQIENDKEFQVARRLIGSKVSILNPGL